MTQFLHSLMHGTKKVVLMTIFKGFFLFNFQYLKSLEFKKHIFRMRYVCICVPACVCDCYPRNSNTNYSRNSEFDIKHLYDT